MSHNRLNRDAAAHLSKPVELQLDCLIDPGSEDGVVLKMQYFGEDTIELRFEKGLFNRTLVRDLLEVRRFGIFSRLKDLDCFTRLYHKMAVHVVDQPSKVIFNIGDRADSLFLVRQGMV